MKCSNLDCKGLCKIHSKLEENGFKGCIRFSCFGAGQRVSNEIFGGLSWQSDPALLEGMTVAFWSLRQIHELQAMLFEAKKLPLPEDVMRGLESLLGQLEPDDGWTQEKLLGYPLVRMKGKTLEFLGSLRRILEI
ncbi:hypothetical protein [Flexibacterium corallicola]|uniref:hypothetical protein n=1 Tax=Flexibacterium corallicola TaxID=3037259 RepID=UPI00286EF8F3|nr:hypothetical protein [Pseudovibrio sp. M1P-2-3]